MSTTLFICSTLYRETVDEIAVLLTSFVSVNRYLRIDDLSIRFHVVLDAVSSSHFADLGHPPDATFDAATSAVSALDKCIHEMNGDPVAISTHRIETVYGWKAHLAVLHGDPIDLLIHYKSASLVRRRKRWSQVLYLQAILKSLSLSPDASATDSNLPSPQHYVLMTDGDVQFDVHAVLRLIVHLRTSPSQSGVCGQIVPRRDHFAAESLLNGSLGVHCLQLAEYWLKYCLNKRTEHVLGTVLCASSCFALFRLADLCQIMDSFGCPPSTFEEHMRSELGEDRWMCNLLIAKSMELAYRHDIVVSTSALTTFHDLLVQRRRWVQSSLPNMLDPRRFTQSLQENRDLHLLLVWYIWCSHLAFWFGPPATIYWHFHGLSVLFSSFLPDSTKHLAAMVLALMIPASCYALCALPTHIITDYNKMKVASSLACCCALGTTVILLVTMYTVVASLAWSLVAVLFSLCSSMLMWVIAREKYCSVVGILLWIVFQPSERLLIPIVTVTTGKSAAWGTREPSYLRSEPLPMGFLSKPMAIDHALRNSTRLVSTNVVQNLLHGLYTTSDDADWVAQGDELFRRSQACLAGAAALFVGLWALDTVSSLNTLFCASLLSYCAQRIFHVLAVAFHFVAQDDQRRLVIRPPPFQPL